MENYKISIVSYLNSAPFYYGLKKFNFTFPIELSEDVPSICADKIKNNSAHIGLIPSITLKTNNYNIITNYCIGAINKVESVCLFSNYPIEEIKEIELDTDSKTSVALLNIIISNFWKLNIKCYYGINKRESVLLIGDKAFKEYTNFKYIYDLSEIWYNFTKLPFVFANWVSNINLPEKLINELNLAFELGLKNLDDSINLFYDKNPNFYLKKEIAKNYLSNNISYCFDINKNKGLNKFLELS